MVINQFRMTWKWFLSSALVFVLLFCSFFVLLLLWFLLIAFRYFGISSTPNEEKSKTERRDLLTAATRIYLFKSYISITVLNTWHVLKTPYTIPNRRFIISMRIKLFVHFIVFVFFFILVNNNIFDFFGCLLLRSLFYCLNLKTTTTKRKLVLCNRFHFLINDSLRVYHRWSLFKWKKIIHSF